MCAIFGPHRNIAKHWDAYEGVFTGLRDQDPDTGVIHLFQGLV